MHRLRRSFLLQSLIAFDVLAVAASLGIASRVTAGGSFGVSPRDLLSARISLGQGLGVLTFLLVSHWVFDHSGLYRSRRLESRKALYGHIAKAVCLIALLAGTAGVVIEEVRVSFVPVFGAVALAIIAASRAMLYWVLETVRRRGRNLRHVLIVGAGPRGQRFAAALESCVELGYSVVGFLDEGIAGGPLLGGFSDLRRILRTGRIDEVAIALPMKTFYPAVSDIVAICEEQGVVVRVLGDLFEARTARVESEQFEDLSLLTLSTGRGSALAVGMKRGADVILSAAGLVALAPVLFLIALAVRFDSPGPACYRQIRAGHNGRRFRMWKFRTMTVDAEQRQASLEQLNEVRGAAFKIRNDPRVTRLGRWLRRSGLDELPQLINVLKGEMSLVGPRPLPLRDVERLSQDWQRRRFSVRPGLTCLWQSGGRHRLEFEEWMRLDLQYIDNWSLLLDMKILLRTVPAIWNGAGASW